MPLGSSAHAAPPPWAPRLQLAVVLLVAATLLFGTLTAQPLWTDEVLRLMWAQGGDMQHVVDAAPATLGRDTPIKSLAETLPVQNRYGPPLHGLLLNWWMRETGARDDFALKWPLACLGVLAVLAAFLAGREVGGPTTGLVTAGFAALSPFQVRYVPEVNHYALGLCLTAFASYLFFRLISTQSVATMVGFALVGTAALYAHYYAAIALFALGVGGLPWLRDGRRARLLIIGGFALTALGFAPYLTTMRAQLAGLTDPNLTGQYKGWRYFTERALANPSWPWLGERGEGLPTWVQFGVFATFATLVVLGLRTEQRARVRWLLAMCLATPLVLIPGAYFLRENNTFLWPRYGLFFTLSWYLPVALLVSRAKGLSRVVPLGLTLGSMSFGLVYLLRDFTKEDWRGAARAVEARASAGEKVLVFPPFLGPAIARYMEGATPITSLPESLQLEALIDRLAAQKTGVFVVGAWWGISHQPTLALELLRCRYPLEEEFVLPGIRVAHFHFGAPRDGDRPTGVCHRRAHFEPPPDGCVSDGTRLVRVTGWVEVPNAEAGVTIMQDLALPITPTLEEPTRSGEGALRRRFAASVDLSHVEPGNVVSLTLKIDAPGAEAGVPPTLLSCLRRPAFVALPWPGEPVERGILSPVGDARLGEPLHVRGWAYSSHGLAALRVLVDDAEVLTTREHGIRGEDVAAAFPQVPHDLAAYSRFDLALEVQGLDAGHHSLRIAAVHPDGGTAPLSTPSAFSLVP